MQTIYTSNNSRHDDKLSILSRIANSAIIIAVSIALLHSTTVLAGSAIKNADQQIAQNVEEYNSKVSIKQSDMTAKMKNGVLTVRMPKKSVPKEIEIKVE